MRFRFTLLSKVLAVAFLNLLLLGVALLLARHESRLDLDSFLTAPDHDRILAASRLLALQLAETERAGWDAVMERYAAANHVTPRLVDDAGRVLAGDRNPLPAPVLERFLARFQPPPKAIRGRGRSRGHHGEYDLAFLGSVSDVSWVASAAPLPDNGGLPRDRHAWIVIAAAGDNDLFFIDIEPWIAVGCVVILISLACWLPFVRGLTRSIKRLTAATAQVAEGHFEIQVPARRRDELGELAASINRMASRLDRLVNGQKRFLRDAAHELRSPLARIQLALGLLDRSAAAAQQPALADLRDDVDHMSSLVDGVLAFSRAPVQAEPVMQDVPLAGLLARVVEREGRDGVAIETSVEDGLAASADPDLLFRAVSNVVRNAVRYAGAAGPVEIVARQDHDQAVLSIADHGPGVPESEREAIFDPFYRLQAARERSTGGVGLGLAIVKASIEACRGAVVCRNRRPSGLEVEFRLAKAANLQSLSHSDAP